VSFKNTVIIMTSNIASPLIQELTRQGANQDVMRAAVLEELQGTLRPEFLNRIDDIIVFRPLSREQIGQIVEIQLGRLRNMLQDRKITLELTPAARERLAEEGYDPIYGARPLKRVIQQRIQNELAIRLLQGEFREGDAVIVDVDSNGRFTFRKAETARAAAA
ncbi:MAG: AAA family ATPase, partial [Roseiflexaceae bacterium]